MNLLVLGGTGFLGYHVVAEALALGHRVTTFNREGASELEGVEALKGDRTGDLSALAGRSWDAVVDTFSDPAAVTATAKLLSRSVPAYGFVSGISIYHPAGPDVVDEAAPLRREGDPEGEDPLQERSLLKLACERALKEHFAGRLFVARPGIMVGPRDPTDRFTWWPLRLARALAGEPSVLAPGRPERAVQFTDARDLAAWMVRALDPAAETGTLTGTFNAVGPGREESLEEVLNACLEAAKDVLGHDAAEDVRFAWADEQFLRERLANTEEEARPLWFPEDQIPFAKVESSRALAAGLSFRSSFDTARDTLLWARLQDERFEAGFAPEVEKKLLEAWGRESRPHTS